MNNLEFINELVHNNIGYADIWEEGNVIYIDPTQVGDDIHAQLDRLMSLYGYVHIRTKVLLINQKHVVNNNGDYYMTAIHEYIHKNAIWEDRYDRKEKEVWSTQ